MHAWFRDGGRWIAWVQHQPADTDDPHAVWGLYLFDGKTIRQRHYPAARASVEVSSRWGPSQTVKTRLRGLGYTVDHVKTGEVLDVLKLG